MPSELTKKNIIIGMLSGSPFKLEDVVSEVQSFCLGLRLEHWKTTDFAAHKALESTQESLTELLDAFVEAGIGLNEGKRPTFNEELKATTDEDTLIRCLKEITTRDTAMLNIRDEMLQALYKFKYLKTLR